MLADAHEGTEDAGVSGNHGPLPPLGSACKAAPEPFSTMSRSRRSLMVRVSRVESGVLGNASLKRVHTPRAERSRGKCSVDRKYFGSGGGEVLCRRRGFSAVLAVKHEVFSNRGSSRASRSREPSMK